MSGATIGGIIGGVIGSYFGPLGAQIGYVAGSLIGGALDPQHLQGPRLGELRIQTVQEGSPRPIVYGQSEWFAGNVIQAGEPVIIETHEQQGKGGGPVIDSQKAYITYAVSFGEPGEIIALRRNGKVVMDFTNPGIADPEAAAILSKITRYNGSDDQNPDPSLESLPTYRGGGVGNTPAYPGTAYIAVAMDDITDLLALPQWECRKASNATVDYPCEEHGLIAWWPLDDASPDGVAREVIGGVNGIYRNFFGECTVESRGSLNQTGNGATWFGHNDGVIAGNASSLGREANEPWTCSVWYSVDAEHTHSNCILGIGYMDDFSGHHAWGNHLSDISGSGQYLTPTGGYGNDGGAHFVHAEDDIGVGGAHYQVTTFDGQALRLYVDGFLVDELEIAGAGGSVNYVQMGDINGFVGTMQDVKLYDYALSGTEVLNKFVGIDNTYELPDAPGVYVRFDGTLVQTCSPTAVIGDVMLADVHLDIARRCGIKC